MNAEEIQIGEVYHFTHINPEVEQSESVKIIEPVDDMFKAVGLSTGIIGLVWPKELSKT